MITVPCHGCDEPIDAERAAIDEHLHPYCEECSELRAALAQTCADCGSVVDHGVQSSRGRLFCIPCGLRRLVRQRDELADAVRTWRLLFYSMACAAVSALVVLAAIIWEAHR